MEINKHLPKRAILQAAASKQRTLILGKNKFNLETMDLRLSLNTQLSQLLSLFLILLPARPQPLPGCPSKCGDVEIPYPFGVGQQPGTARNCFLEKPFNLTCQNNTLILGKNIRILNISFQGSMDIFMYVSRICYNESGGVVAQNNPSLRISAFTISSTQNKFISVGCDTYGYLNSTKNETTYSTGCLTRCGTIPDEENSRNCSGIGCCQEDIPRGMRNISFEAYSFNKHRQVLHFNNCSYAFVAKRGWFNFSLHYLKYLPDREAPLVVDWTIPIRNASTRPHYACAANADHHDSDDGYGYNCRCRDGFAGNPYHPDGCHDIDECKEGTHNCTSKENCRDKIGSFECYCPPGYSGNGTISGRCQPPKSPLITVLIGVSAGLVSLFVGLSWLYLVYQKRKLMKLKETFFRKNGGFMLQQLLSTKQGSSQMAKIFTSEELKKATNNYHDILIIGKGGFGTVYKGFLADNTIVAIKKSKEVDQNQIEQFINEVIVLSQINHKNVVKLLGCCLETEVPLLVYEFVNNGTLYEYIHNKGKDCNISWETRWRIAVEAAKALSYLHSAASIPIIHRDVKSSNILLDENYTAKVSDFGASRLAPLDRTELATMVQGTLGYLDPEYLQTNQLTEKSDVYSFGVVLVELLTGKKALSFDRPEKEQSLAMHFLSCLNQGRLSEVLEVGVMNNENKEMLEEVAKLAERCLRLRGEERPSMKEVENELEGIIRMTGEQAWADKDLKLEETQSLLGETSGLSEYGDSINPRDIAWDSITDHVLNDFDNGR